MEQPDYFTFGIQSDIPPRLDPGTTLPRTDEVNAIIHQLNDAHTSTLLITGMAGAGKSTLAALVFSQLLAKEQQTSSPFQRHVWLRVGPRTTWPDIVTALFNRLQSSATGDQRLSQRTDLRALYELLLQKGQPALIVLDQCEELFDRAIEAKNQSTPYTVGVGLSGAVRFLEMLQQDLGENRIILTCTRSPYGTNYQEAPGVREHVVEGLTIVDGISLLQQKGLLGLQQDLSLAWQHCSGHIYALLLLSAWKKLSGLSLHYLLNSPLYQVVWEGTITYNLAEALTGFLNPVQFSLVRALCLFREPVPLVGIIEVARGERNRQEPGTGLFEQEMANLVALSLVEQFEHFDGVSRYALQGILGHYLLDHYLESEQKRNSGFLGSSLGVVTQPGSQGVEQEENQIALAAGQMRVASYYARVARQMPTFQQRTRPNDATPLLAMLEHSCLGWHWQSAYDQLSALKLDTDLLRWEMWHTLIKLYEMMLPPSGSLKRRDEGLVYSSLSMIYGRIGEYEQSRVYYTSALAIQRDMADKQSEAITLINQGEFLRVLGDGELARQSFEQALSLLPRETDPQLACVLMHNVGLLTQQQGKFKQSLQSFLKSFELARRLQDQEKEGIILTNIGLLLCEQKRFAEGLALLLPALQMRLAQHDPNLNSLIAFLKQLEQKMGNSTFLRLSQQAQAAGQQEKVLQSISEL